MESESSGRTLKDMGPEFLEALELVPGSPVPWVMGDWYLYGLKNYGQKRTRQAATDRFGPDITRLLARWAKVSKAYPPEEVKK